MKKGSISIIGRQVEEMDLSRTVTMKVVITSNMTKNTIIKNINQKVELFTNPELDLDFDYSIYEHEDEYVVVTITVHTE